MNPQISCDEDAYCIVQSHDQEVGMVLKDDVHLSFDFTHWCSLVFLVAYFTLWTYWTNGRSAGKWLFGIRVVSLVHERMTLWSSFERSLGYGASFLEFGFGFLQYFIHPNRSTVHDRIAETIVIKERVKVVEAPA